MQQFVYSVASFAYTLYIGISDLNFRLISTKTQDFFKNIIIA